MDVQELTKLIDDLRSGTVTSEDAFATLSNWSFADLGFARVDHHRSLRQGMPEAIYAPGKSPAQCAAIAAELLDNGTGPVLLTRANAEQAAAALERCPGGTIYPDEALRAEHHVIYWRASEPRAERVVIVTAGTADLPVAGECAATLRAFGFGPVVLADCGVAGVHRLLANYDELAGADVIVVAAGMEGALASVVGGLVAAPVVAIPTSVGYGAALEGVTALLAMHASCAPGVTVVGIDNGYGAACAVARILR
jgi:NCAIR mutase (PurE)-related protein